MPTQDLNDPNEEKPDTTDAEKDPDASEQDENENAEDGEGGSPREGNIQQDGESPVNNSNPDDSDAAMEDIEGQGGAAQADDDVDAAEAAAVDGGLGGGAAGVAAVSRTAPRPVHQHEVRVYNLTDPTDLDTPDTLPLCLDFELEPRESVQCME